MFENFTISDYAAWWGATIATTLLLWDIFKYFQEKPRIKVNVRPYTVYKNSEVIEVETLKSGQKTSTMKPSIHIEVSNIGKTATTLLNLHVEGKLQQYQGVYASTEPEFPQAKKLPVLLNQGETWICGFDQYIFHQNKIKELSVVYSVSHDKKPQRKKFKI